MGLRALGNDSSKIWNSCDICIVTVVTVVLRSSLKLSKVRQVIAKKRAAFRFGTLASSRKGGGAAFVAGFDGAGSAFSCDKAPRSLSQG